MQAELECKDLTVGVGELPFSLTAKHCHSLVTMALNVSKSKERKGTLFKRLVDLALEH